MQTVVAIYTGHGLMERVRALFASALPTVRLVNIIDDSIIADVISAGKVTPNVARRLIGYFYTARDMGADVILSTCSSVGDIIPMARRLVDTPIVRIDEAMARQAVEAGGAIGVLATLPTTLDPTVRLLNFLAEESTRKVRIVEGLAQGAYQALVAGKPEEHDRLLMSQAVKIASGVDTIVLAQGSMARMQEAIEEETGRRVLASPQLAVADVSRRLSAMS